MTESLLQKHGCPKGIATDGPLCMTAQPVGAAATQEEVCYWYHIKVIPEGAKVQSWQTRVSQCLLLAARISFNYFFSCSLLIGNLQPEAACSWPRQNISRSIAIHDGYRINLSSLRSKLDLFDKKLAVRPCPQYIVWATFACFGFAVKSAIPQLPI